MRALMSGSFSTALTSSFTFLMMSGGAPARACNAFQLVTTYSG